MTLSLVRLSSDNKNVDYFDGDGKWQIYL
jgi:hypothetical protein